MCFWRRRNSAILEFAKMYHNSSYQAKQDSSTVSRLSYTTFLARFKHSIPDSFQTNILTGLVCDFHAASCVFVFVDIHVDMLLKTQESCNSRIHENVKAFSFKQEAIRIPHPCWKVQWLVCDSHAALCVSVSVDPRFWTRRICWNSLNSRKCKVFFFWARGYSVLTSVRGECTTCWKLPCPNQISRNV